MSLQGGKNRTSSKALTGAERTDIFNSGQSAIQNGMDSFNAPVYQQGTYKAMSDGDYNNLENSIYQSRTAGLDRAKSLDSQRIDSDLAKRGIWSSGLAQAAQGDNNERYATNYLQAGSDAATQRYQAQQADLAGANAFDAAERDKQYQSKWQPLNYLSNLWGGTSGQNASGSGFTAGISAGS